MPWCRWRGRTAGCCTSCRSPTCRSCSARASTTRRSCSIRGRATASARRSRRRRRGSSAVDRARWSGVRWRITARRPGARARGRGFFRVALPETPAAANLSGGMSLPRMQPPDQDGGDPPAQAADSGFERTLDQALDGGFAAARELAPPAGDSVLRHLEHRLGSRPAVSLRDVDHDTATPMLKPLVIGDGVERTTGKYVVHGLLGQGGVGAVHKGHDTDLGRDVAIKFLHARYRTDPAVLHRFVEEAQIGGQLQHPGIVPVYELGMANGRPFFAMKLVKGQTLAEKLARRASPADDRRTFLATFEDICQTMAYAHARGVVHRDLKPANVMIGSFGEVQVVDWGMGKVLERGGVADEKRAAELHSNLSVIETLRSSGHGTQSVMGSVMGTPAYMPPEQARGDIDQMDARSDVFALGAILCEILTGLPPYAGPAQQLIGMAAMAKLDDARARLENCGAERDLVDLTLQCLMPAPAARPMSAEKVAAVIHGHLAAAEERVHRARVEAAEAKVRAVSLRRAHGLGIALATVFAAGLAVSLWFWREADAQRSLAAQAAENEKAAAAIARAQRDQAERIGTFLAETLQGAGPAVALGRDTAMLREMLDAAAKRIDRGELAEAREAELRLRLSIGDTYRELAAYDDAQRVLEPAVALARALRDDGATARALRSVAQLLLERGDLAAAEHCARESLATSRRLHPGDHPDVANGLGVVASVLATRGGLSAAEELFREALAIVRRVQPVDHAAVARALNDLGLTLLSRGGAEAAEALLRESLQTWRQLHPGDHPEVANALSTLAGAQMTRGELTSAEALYREALDMRRRLLPADHPNIAMGISNVAMVLRRSGDLAAAEPLLREVLAIDRRNFRGDHMLVATSLANLASVCLDRGDLDEAEPLFADAAAMERRLFPNDHRRVATALHNLAVVRQHRDDAAGAEALFEEAVAMLRRLPELHPSSLASFRALADLLVERNDLAGAEAVQREALATARRVFAADHPEVAGGLNNLGVAVAARGDFEAAESLYREAVAMWRRLGAGDHAEIAGTLDNLAGVLRRRGDAAAAEALRLEAAALRRRPGAASGAPADGSGR
ncbi:MAG: serine/threonine protein kinase [Planctomycetes bacterium]|nr:serine/threonine protein kinase [Planctomycetota bacterium]